MLTINFEKITTLVWLLVLKQFLSNFVSSQFNFHQSEDNVNNYFFTPAVLPKKLIVLSPRLCDIMINGNHFADISLTVKQ